MIRDKDGLLDEAIERALDGIQNAALEAAAKVAERHGETVSNEMIGKACSRNIAAAIRALKGR